MKKSPFFPIPGKAPLTAAPYIAMKNLFSKSLIALAAALLLVCCAERFPSRYALELPETPAAWVSLLGEPHWRVEWVNPDGQKQTADFPPGKKKSIELEIPVTWINPVTAWPWWPRYNLTAFIFKPCGALFPFDVLPAEEKGASGKSNHLRLTWESGPDTVFYWELAIASKNKKKTPANFDWPRFRELFQSDALSDAVRKDPWVVSWRTVAEKTISSNFDKRRITPEAPVLKHIPVSACSQSGPWYGISPFSEPLLFAEGEPAIFPVRKELYSSGINIWVSAEGMLRVNGNTWIFTPWEKF